MNRLLCIGQVVYVACLAACGFPRPADLADDGGVIDAPALVDADAPVSSDASVPADASPGCFGQLINICLSAVPVQPLNIQDVTTIDTDTSSMCSADTNRSEYCVLAATDITVGAALRATGTRPLILLASGTLRSRASGVIDVGSHRVRPQGSPEIGAGADPAACAVGTLPGNSGGGAGGSFVGSGGAGGFNNGLDGSAPGLPSAPVTFITDVRGGCAGQDGSGHAAKGHGGGAVFLIANVSIIVDGLINAAGEGGAESAAGGGGGGGAGGMIGLDAPTVTVTSLLLASGGGGGGGGGALGGAPGPGADPTTVGAAAGGVGTGEGGIGGNGSEPQSAGSGAMGQPGFSSDLDSNGGGGGGGGAGIIKAPAAATFAVATSPPAVR